VTVRQLGVGCLGVIVLLLGYVGFLLFNQWVPQTVGRYETIRNRFTGKVQIKHEGRFQETVSLTPTPNALTADELRRIRLSDVAWGKHSLLTGTATVAPGEPLRGRLAFQIVVLGGNDKRRLIESERNLRRTVDWPGGATIPFVLDTEFRLPAPGEKTSLTLVPVLLEGAAAGDPVGKAAKIKLPTAPVAPPPP